MAMLERNLLYSVRLLFLGITILVLGCIPGIDSVEITNKYETVSQKVCDFESEADISVPVELILNCKFNYSTPGGTVFNPTTIWKYLDANEIVGLINGSGILNPGPNYIGLVRRLNNNIYDGSIILRRNAPNVSVFSCSVTIPGDYPASQTNYISVTATDDKLWPGVAEPIAGIAVGCAGLLVSMPPTLLAFAHSAVIAGRRRRSILLAACYLGILSSIFGIVLLSIYVAQGPACKLEHEGYRHPGIVFGFVGLVVGILAAFYVVSLIRRKKGPDAPRDITCEPMEGVTPSIMVSWDPPPENNHGKITSYKILYVEKGDKNSDARIAIGEPHLYYHVLKNLSKCATYRIWMLASNVSGDGYISQEKEAQTKVYAPDAPPQDVMAKAIDAGAVEVTWQPPSVDRQNGNITHCKIYYIKESDYAKDTVRPRYKLVGPNEESFVLKQLSKSTVYTVWMTATTTAGEGPESSHFSVQTDEDVPGRPRLVAVEPITSTSVRVEWVPSPTADTDQLTGYRVHYVPVDRTHEDTYKKSYVDSMDVGKHEMVIGDLDPSTYIIYVTAHNRKGCSTHSGTLSVSTMTTVAPGAVMTAHII